MMEKLEEDSEGVLELSAGNVEDRLNRNTLCVGKESHLAVLEKLLSDPLLADLPAHLTLHDVDTLIALEKGSAMSLTVIKMDGVSYGKECKLESTLINGLLQSFGSLDDTFAEIPVLQSASVGDLKLAIQRKVEDGESKQLGRRSISWKHVWSKFCLSSENVRLTNDKMALSEYEMKNGSEVIIPFYACDSNAKETSFIVEASTRLIPLDTLVRSCTYAMSRCHPRGVKGWGEDDIFNGVQVNFTHMPCPRDGQIQKKRHTKAKAKRSLIGRG